METELKTCTDKTPFPFMKYKWLFMSVSVFFMAMSVYQIAFKGLNFGVDFKGGNKMIYQFVQDVAIEDVRASFAKSDVGDVEVLEFGAVVGEHQYLIRSKYIENVNSEAIITQALKTKFGAEQVTLLSQELVGPKVGQDMQWKALKSIVFTCVLILIYIWVRFDFLFAPGAIIALIHDVLISAGFFAFFGKEFNLPILAALLTILGYSINDTIVIYDRVRENIARLPKRTTTEELIDVSVTETMSRTIVTSLTVLFVVVVLFFIGGGVLHDFAFCLIVGLIFGSYSTVFIASPFYMFMQRWFPGRGLKSVVPEEKKRIEKVAV